MLTPQEVSNRAFTKAPFNGYNMAMVDEFLDELTDDYTALYKENAALKAKMKVMVEKVEEYRATEDSMRSALLAAQRMADSIIAEAEARRDQLVSEAETRREQMMAEAERSARERIQSAQQEARALDQRIRLGRRDMARFIAASRELCHQQLAFLEKLPQIQVETGEAIPVPDTGERDTYERIDEKARTVFASVGEAEDDDSPSEEAGEDSPSVTPRVRTGGRRFKLEELKLGMGVRRDREKDENRRAREDAVPVSDTRFVSEEA